MDDAEIEERFCSLGPVAIRRMFGGKGIYRNGCILAIIHSGELLLKTDAETARLFEDAGARRWTYSREGQAPVGMPYHSLPDEALDDPERMSEWARLAMEAALRAGPPKRKCRAPADP